MDQLASPSLLIVLMLISVVPIFSIQENPCQGCSFPLHNLNDCWVVESADFAVREHNKKANNTRLHFVRVIKGDGQVVGGMKYMLVISAKDGAIAPPKNYYAVIVSKIWDENKPFELFSFKQLTKH